MAKGVYIGVPPISNPGPFSSTSGWNANQNVTLSVNGGAIKVTSNQSSSTPGMYTQLTSNIPANTSLTLTVTMRGNVRVMPCFYNSTTSATLSISYQPLTSDYQTITVSGTTSGVSDRLYFFMTSPTTSSWFEIGSIQLTYGVARKVKKMYIGVSSVAREVKKGYVGVGGVARQFYSGLPPIGTPLENMTWAQIRAVSDAGVASSYFSVGDTKTITLNGTAGGTTFSNFSIRAVIAGIDHNSAREGSNRIHFFLGEIARGTSWVRACLIPTPYEATGSGFLFNTTTGSSVNWSSSSMRSTILGNSSTPTSPVSGSVMALLPSDLRAVMKSVTKYTDISTSASSSSMKSTTDYLFLPSAYELGLAVADCYGTTSKYSQTEQSYQQTYPCFAESGHSDSGFYKHNNTGSYGHYWTRSKFRGNGAGRHFIKYGPYGYTEGTPTDSWGIVPFFCV